MVTEERTLKERVNSFLLGISRVQVPKKAYRGESELYQIDRTDRFSRDQQRCVIAKLYIGDENGEHIYGGATGVQAAKALTVLLDHPRSYFRTFRARIRGARALIKTATIVVDEANKHIALTVHGVINAGFAQSLLNSLTEKFPDCKVEFSGIENHVSYTNRRVDLNR